MLKGNQEEPQTNNKKRATPGALLGFWFWTEELSGLGEAASKSEELVHSSKLRNGPREELSLSPACAAGILPDTV